jgi:hypothetical protein
VSLLLAHSLGPVTAQSSSVECSSTLAVVNPAEALRRYSSTANNDAAGAAHAQSMLDSPQAWNPLSNPGLGEWVQMDLGSSRYVAQVVTQGRADIDQRVTQYTVQHSMDGITFTEVAAVFEGNTDRSTQVFATLPEPVLARYVRVVPQACVTRCAMRAAVMKVGCPGDSAGGDVMVEQVAGDEAVAGAVAEAPTYVGCWSGDDGIGGWPAYSAAAGSPTYFTRGGVRLPAGDHAAKVAHCAQLCASAPGADGQHSLEGGYPSFIIHDSTACFCGAGNNEATATPTGETEAAAIATGCMNYLYSSLSLAERFQMLLSRDDYQQADCRTVQILTPPRMSIVLGLGVCARLAARWLPRARGSRPPLRVAQVLCVHLGPTASQVTASALCCRRQL